MQAFPSQAIASPEARPYGPVGLILGSLAIIGLTTIICLFVVLIALGVAAAILGLQGLLERLAALRSVDTVDKASLVQIGIGASLVLYAAIVLAIMLMARFRAGGRWREIVALYPWHPFRGTMMFWAAAGLGFLYNIGASALIAWIYPASKDWIVTPTAPVGVLGFVLLAVIFAPVAEEMVFRGWLYTSLKRSIGVIATIVITSVLFALAHWEDTHLYALAVLPVGIALGIIREKTGTIAASMVFHAFYNGAACVLLVLGF